MTEQDQIDAYKRVEAFLAEPAVKDAIRKLNEQFYGQFKDADTVEKREQAWAKSRALDALSAELMAVMSTGQVALRQREAQDRARAARAPRK